MIDASILLYSSYGGVLMRSKRIPAEEQYRLIMECRQSGLTDHQWCVEHDIKPGTFYNWVKRLRQKGCVDLPASTGSTYCKRYSGVRPHKDKINISKEIINKTRGAVAPYAAQIFTHLSVVSSRQRSYDWLRCEGKSRG